MISVIIPVFSTERFLDGCIRSITSQSYRELEILLVDDCSTDDSGRIVDCWAQKIHESSPSIMTGSAA